MERPNGALFVRMFETLPSLALMAILLVMLSGCVSEVSHNKQNAYPAIVWDGTEHVTFLMAYQTEVSGGLVLYGMVRDQRGRRHKLFDSHIDAQFIGTDGSVLGGKCIVFWPLPRPRVLYRLARFSLPIEESNEPIIEYRLHYHETKQHCSS